MKRVEAIIRPERLGEVASLLEQKGLFGFTISDVRGHGRSAERSGEYRGHSFEMLVSHKLQIQLYVEDDEVEAAVSAIAGGATTGQVGDGLIAVSEVATMYRISAVPTGAV
jgi:nitrogen regulatory protein P-II 1